MTESAQLPDDDSPFELDSVSLALLEDEIAPLRDRFVADTIHQLKALTTRCDTAIEWPADHRQILSAVFGMAHDLKGLGTSFGFRLAGDVAALLCTLTRNRESADSAARRAIVAHLTALLGILDQRLMGDGGEVGRLLVGRLQAMAAAGAA